MQIHELNDFTGATDSSYLAIDDGIETMKIPANNVGVSTEMTQAEAEAGTETAPRVISPAVLNGYANANFASKQAVGRTYYASASTAISTADINTYSQGASVSLPAGTYVIKGQFSFNSATFPSGTTSRLINADLSTVAGATADTAPLGRVRIANGAGNWSRLEVMAIATFTETTTVYVKGSSTLTSTGNGSTIYAVRII